MTASLATLHPWATEFAHRVRFGIETVAFAPWPVLRAFGQAVEALGFDSLWLSDHPMLAGSATWTHLAALAEATRRVRLGPLVACVPYLNPAILARATADHDLISGGRAVLGLGSGNAPPEFAQLGLPLLPARERQAQLAEALQIVVPLLRGETVTASGGTFRPQEAVLSPPPMQSPHVPILVGGGGEQTTLRYAAQYADASNLGPASRTGGGFQSPEAARRFAVLDGHLAAAGRPAAAVLRTGLLAAFLSPDLAAARAKQAALSPEMATLFVQLPFIETVDVAVRQVQAMLTVGIRYVIFIVMPGDEETLKMLAERVLPDATSPTGHDNGLGTPASSR